MTLINLVLGWWGFISFFVTPVFILLNLVRYALCLGMSPVPARAVRPELTDSVVALIRPHGQQIISRLKSKEDLKRIAADIAYASGATPGQVLLYICSILQAARMDSKE
jgi:hypothetical protein